MFSVFETEKKPALGFSLLPQSGSLGTFSALRLAYPRRLSVVELTIDSAWNNPIEADYLADMDRLLAKYRKVGHMVRYSLVAPHNFSKDDKSLISSACAQQRRFNFEWITLHYGCTETEEYGFMAPLPVPFTTETLRQSTERLKRFAGEVACPVGIENLAHAFSLEGVKQQGEFIDRLLEPVNGVLLLDIHNLYCQSINFGVPMAELAAAYPLDRVREIHVSGGSWSKATCGGHQFRRDTHDGPMPEELLAFLPWCLAACPALEVVIFERLFRDGRGEFEAADDFRRLAKAIRVARPQPGVVVSAPVRGNVPEAADGAAMGYFRTLLSYLKGRPDGVTDLPDLSGHRADSLEVAGELLEKWSVRR